MAATETSICNLALQILGSPSVTSLADAGKPAREMNACYAQVRDGELEKHVWKFARELMTPALSGTTPAHTYAYAFELPNDFLRLILPANNQCDWEIHGSNIYTNEGSVIRGAYIKRVTDPTKFPSTFISALAAALAMQTCEAITQSDAKWNKASAMYRDAINLAKRTNALQRTPQETDDDTWVTARLG